ncbi:MAG: NAD(P)H-binding protein [Paracoccaceae bacterium]|jgi:divinyl chlorophyllide a 8-vinyl-reductase|nr:NAD(P)H-binding protein [Paracoccaceae bacterium]
MAEQQGRRVLLAGGTGTIGQATARALLRAGHEVVALARPGRAVALPPGVEPVEVDVAVLSSLRIAGRFDAVISCLASRTGAPAEAWAIEHRAQGNLLALARETGAAPFVLLSAICVQKPLLQFQKAKLAFERELQESGVPFAIVRPTAFFKSLSGQAERVRAGKPFLLFGDGALTACKPISDDDLARYLVRCLTDQGLQGRILPIGGPGPVLTPRAQGEALFAAFGVEPRFRHVPVRMMDAIIGGLSMAGRVSRALADKAEFARIGRYYATESMLVLDPETGRYDADATPETGTETLPDFYRRLAAGEATVDLGAHAVF